MRASLIAVLSQQRAHEAAGSTRSDFGGARLDPEPGGDLLERKPKDMVKDERESAIGRSLLENRFDLLPRVQALSLCCG
jgi:hypothetical protein